MKNLKKIVLGLMLLLAVFAFVGCPTPEQPAPTPTPEQPAGGNEGTEQKPSAGGNGEGKEENTPVVTNNFKGKTFLGMTGEGEDAYFASYIIFTSDKDCEVMFFDEEPIPATYTVADDVATLTGTGENAELQLSTTKLTDGKFSITIPPAVSGEEENIVVSYAVGTLWTILYDIPDSDEDFSLKMPEEELEFAVEYFEFVEDDYTKDDATKTITLTASGFAKVLAAMGGDEEGDQPADGEYIVMHNGEIFTSFSTLEEFEAFLSELDKYDPKTDSGDYYSDDAFTVVLTDEGYAKLTGNGDDEEDPPADDEELPETWEKRESFEGLDGKWAKKEISNEFLLEMPGKPTIIDSEEYFLIEGTSIEFGIYLEMDYSDIVAGYAVNNNTTPEEAYIMLQESLNQFFDNYCTYEDNYIVKANPTTPVSLEDVIFEDERGTSSLFVNEKLSKIKLYMEAYKDSEGNLLVEPSIEELIYTKQ